MDERDLGAKDPRGKRGFSGAKSLVTSGRGCAVQASVSRMKFRLLAGPRTADVHPSRIQLVMQLTRSQDYFPVLPAKRQTKLTLVSRRSWNSASNATGRIERSPLTRRCAQDSTKLPCDQNPTTTRPMVRRLRLVQVNGFTNSRPAGTHVAGRSRPLFAIGRTTSGNNELIPLVMKVSQPCDAPAGEGPHRLLRELLCNRVLAKLGVNVPEPFVVEVDPRLVALISAKDPVIGTEFTRHLGPHFATRRLEGFSDVQPHQLLRGSQYHDPLEDLYAADALILNGDRTHGKPNLMWNAHGIAAIDHGLAFEMLAVNNCPILPLDFLVHHVAFRTLRRKNIRFGRVFEKWVRELSQSMIVSIANAAPNEWHEPAARSAAIVSYLQAHEARLDGAVAHLCSSLQPEGAS